ncbi:MAG: PfkB family carbohydrate kinase [Nitrososphaerales archaeon]
MVKILIVGHITIDQIASYNRVLTSVGGPPSYVGLMATRLGAQVDAATKVGLDFPEQYLLFLSRYINLLSASLSYTKPTTRFLLQQQGDDRTIKLIARCEDIEENQIISRNYDICVLNPVAGEVSAKVAAASKNSAKCLFMDPQGFLRRFDSEGFCTLSSMDKDLLKDVDVLKVDYEEMRCITGLQDPQQALSELHKLGPKLVILTAHRGYVTISTSKSIYKIPIPEYEGEKEVTGAGDILVGAFAATYAQNMDVLWAGCVGVSAASLSVRGVGISKIPSREDVLQFAEGIFRGVEIY